MIMLDSPWYADRRWWFFCIGYGRKPLTDHAPRPCVPLQSPSLNALHRIPLLLLIFILAACSTPLSASQSPSSSATAAPSSTATPAPGFRVLFTASSASSSDIYLYDSASSAPQHLVTLGTGFAPEPRFISAQKIAYVDTTNQGSSRIMEFDLSSHAATADVSATGQILAFAVSHDGSKLAYLEHDATSGKATLHVRSNGQDSPLALNAIPGRGISRDDEVRLEYAPDDHFLLMVDTFVGNQALAPETGQFLVLRSGDNTVAFLPPSGNSTNATMAVWARGSDRLYYRDQSGVRSWEANATAVGTLVAGLRWYDPAVSPDGDLIAFTEFDPRGVPHVRTYDIARHQVASTSSQPRSHPILVTSDTMWNLEEQACTGECLGGPTTTTGKVFSYNLKTSGENGLPFTDVNTLSELAVSSR